MPARGSLGGSGGGGAGASAAASALASCAAFALAQVAHQIRLTSSSRLSLKTNHARAGFVSSRRTQSPCLHATVPTRGHFDSRSAGRRHASNVEHPRGSLLTMRSHCSSVVHTARALRPPTSKSVFSMHSRCAADRTVPHPANAAAATTPAPSERCAQVTSGIVVPPRPRARRTATVLDRPLVTEHAVALHRKLANRDGGLSGRGGG